MLYSIKKNELKYMECKCKIVIFLILVYFFKLFFCKVKLKLIKKKIFEIVMLK